MSHNYKSEFTEDWNDDEDDDDVDYDLTHQYQQERSKIMHPTLYIEDIPATLTNDGLYNLFSEFGTIIDVNTRLSIKIKNTKIGFVTYNSQDAAQKAIQKMNRTSMNLKVSMKLPKLKKSHLVKDGETDPEYRNVQQGSKKSFNEDRSSKSSFPGKQHISTSQRDIRESKRVEEGRILERTASLSGHQSHKAGSVRSYQPSEFDDFEQSVSSVDTQNHETQRRAYQFSECGSFVNRQDHRSPNKPYNEKFQRQMSYGRSMSNISDTNSDILEDEDEEIDLECIQDEDIAITVTEKGRKIFITPQAQEATPFVTPVSTQIALSKRPEFSSEMKNVYHDTSYRKQFSEYSGPHHDQGMARNRNLSAYALSQQELDLIDSFDRMGTHEESFNMKKHHSVEFLTQSNLQAFNRPNSKGAYNPMETKTYFTEERAAAKKPYVRELKTQQLPIRKPFKCLISYAENPDILWIQFDFKKLSWLKQQLKENFIPSDTNICPRIKFVYLISRNSTWYRGKVIQIDEIDKSTVLFVDYGEVNRDVMNSKFSLIPNELLNLPTLATKCKVAPHLIEKSSNAREIFEACYEKEVTITVDKINDTYEIVNIDILSDFCEVPEDFQQERTNLRKAELKQHKNLQEENRQQMAGSKLRTVSNLTTSVKSNDSSKHRAATVADLPEIHIELKDVNTVLLVYVENAYNISICLGKYVSQFESLNRVLSKSASTVSSELILKKGDLVEAKFVDDFWYRAEILEIHSIDAGVNFIDFGNKELVSFKNIRPISHDALQYPQFRLVVSIGKVSTSLQPLQELVNCSLDMKVINDNVHPVLVEFFSNNKPVLQANTSVASNSVIRSIGESKLKQKSESPNKPPANFMFQKLKRRHIELGPVEAFIAHVTTDFIYIVPDPGDTLNNLLATLDKFSENIDKNISYRPQTGELCLAYTNKELHRAVCRNCLPNSSKFVVFFFDYGVLEEVEDKNLRPYSDVFADYPMMAVKCFVEDYPQNKSITEKIKFLSSSQDVIKVDVIKIKHNCIEIKF